MERRVASHGVELFTLTRGTGRPLLFPTPGWGPSHDLYARTLGPLEERFEVTYIDTRGTGRSTRPADADYSIDAFLDDLEVVREALGHQTVWVGGHSMGGLWAQRYAIAHPARVDGLMLLDTFPGADDEANADMQARMASRSSEPWFEDAVAAFTSGPSEMTDAGLAAMFPRILPFYFTDQQAIARHAEAFAATTFSADAFQHVLGPGGASILDEIARIAAPAVLTVGSDDFICSPVQCARIAERLSGPHRVVEIADAGHFPWLERPGPFFAGVNEALDALIA